MDSASLALIGLAFAVSLSIYLAIERLRISRYKTNGALTPPASVSTAKAQPGNDDLFPPDRRHVLAALPCNSLKGPGKPANELSGVSPDYSRLTPDKAVCNTNDFLDHTTATGFTVDEIRRLGDFPDYASLSGIPLPNEHKEFDINTALPRPYRPYRWPYYQTMCTYTKFSAFEIVICVLTHPSTHQTRTRLLARIGQKLSCRRQATSRTVQAVWPQCSDSSAWLGTGREGADGDMRTILVCSVSSLLRSRQG